MDWDKIKIFHAVVQCGNISAAGELLRICQSAVSRHISTLEYQLKTRLFHRHRRGVSLSEDGQILFDVTSKLIGELSQIESFLRDNRNEAQGLLKIAATDAFCHGFLMSALAEFQTTYTEISVALRQHQTTILNIPELDMARIDVAIPSIPFDNRDDLYCEQLCEYYGRIYAHEDYLNRFGEPKTLSDLDKHRLVVFEEPLVFYADPKKFNWLLYAGQSDGKRRNPSMVVNDGFSLVTAIEAGYGIGITPMYRISDNPKIVEILKEHRDPKAGHRYRKFFVCSRMLTKSKKVQVFRDFLVKAVEGIDPLSPCLPKQ